MKMSKGYEDEQHTLQTEANEIQSELQQEEKKRKTGRSKETEKRRIAPTERNKITKIDRAKLIEVILKNFIK